jgi:hypothetical protein
MRRLGLRSVGKLANDDHEPVLYLLQKQNRELSFIMRRGANRSSITKYARWLSPGKWTKCICHTNFDKWFQVSIKEQISLVIDALSPLVITYGQNLNAL